MNTDELIAYLRRMAQYGTAVTETDRQAIKEAADRLEDLDERVAIMAANMDSAWGNNYN